METEFIIGLADTGKTQSIDNDYEISDIDFKAQLDSLPIITETISEADNEGNGLYEEVLQLTENETALMSISNPQKNPPEKPPRPKIKEDITEDEYSQNPNQRHKAARRSPWWKLYAIAIAALILAALALLLTLIQFGTTMIQVQNTQDLQRNSTQEIKQMLVEQNFSFETLQIIVTQLANNSKSKFENIVFETAKVWEQLGSLEKSNEQFRNHSNEEISSLWTELNALKENFQFTNDITQLNSSLQNLRKHYDNKIQSLTEQLNNSTKLMQLSLNELVFDINTLNEHIFHPASSCKEIPLDQPSGFYWVYTTTGINRVYCDMNSTRCLQCNNSIGWTRVANLDLTDPMQQSYPNAFMLFIRTMPPLRTVGRPDTRGCVSATYDTFGIEYSNVCGRIIGYQDKQTDAFSAYYSNRSLTLDTAYVDGVSLTHGLSPRQHIWTFAGASGEMGSDQSTCPCTNTDSDWNGVVPPFIDNDYFCATGSRQTTENIFYSDDPLWDGQGCGENSHCCDFNSPPWFCKQLREPTTDDIELRLCGNSRSSTEDIKVEIVELYIS